MGYVIAITRGRKTAETFCLFIYYRILGGNSLPIYSYIALPCVSVFWRQDGQGGSLMSFVEKVVAQFARPTGFLGNIAGFIMAHRPSNRLSRSDDDKFY